MCYTGGRNSCQKKDNITKQSWQYFPSIVLYIMCATELSLKRLESEREMENIMYKNKVHILTYINLG